MQVYEKLRLERGKQIILNGFRKSYVTQDMESPVQPADPFADMDELTSNDIIDNLFYNLIWCHQNERAYLPLVTVISYSSLKSTCDSYRIDLELRDGRVATRESRDGAVS